MLDSWPVLLTLIAVIGAIQVLLWILARGLGTRLEARAMAVGIVLPVVFLWPWLVRPISPAPVGIIASNLPGATVEPAKTPHDVLNDTVYQLLPWESEVRRAYREGRLPLWSDLLEGGSSPWINPQAQPVSPIAMATRVLPLALFFTAGAFIKLMIAIQGCWLLCRTAGAGRWGAVLGAMSFGLGGGMVGWALFPLTSTAAWMPWVVAGAVRVARRPGRAAVATTAAVTAAMLLSGNPEAGLGGGLLAAACGLGLRRRGTSLTKSLAPLALAATLGFGLAAAHLLPFLRFVPHSERAVHSRHIERFPSYFELTRPGTWFRPGALIALVAPANPYTFGRPYEGRHPGPGDWPGTATTYNGLLVLAGAGLAVTGRRRRRALVFAGFGFAVYLLVTGFTPLDVLHRNLPLLASGNVARYLFAAGLALSVAGALGVEELLRTAPRRRLAAVLLVLAAISLVVAFSWHVVVLWSMLLLAAGLCSVRPRSASRRWAVALLVAVVLLDLVGWGRRHLARAPADHFVASTPTLDAMRRHLESGPWRATGHGHATYPSLLPLYGIADVRPHNPLAHADQLAVLTAAFDFDTRHAYFVPFRNLEHPVLDFLNVRVVVSKRKLPSGTGLTRLDDASAGRGYVYVNPEALPRCFMARGADVIERGELAEKLKELREPRRVLLWADEAAGWKPEEGGGDVHVVEHAAGRVVLEPSGPGLLATSLPHPSGWTARAGGRRLDRLTVNGAFAGFRIPAGAQRVVLRFVPPGFRVGVLVSLISVLGCLIVGITPGLPRIGNAAGGK